MAFGRGKRRSKGAAEGEEKKHGNSTHALMNIADEKTERHCWEWNFKYEQNESSFFQGFYEGKVQGIINSYGTG